ncbi:unnamed protein product, partial [marine sediment metagenome]
MSKVLTFKQNQMTEHQKLALVKGFIMQKNVSPWICFWKNQSGE